MTIAHSHPSRRDLLRGASWTAFGGISLLTLPLASRQALAADAGARWDRTLVAFHFGGGNDGLNTVVPYADPEYRRVRRTIALPQDQILQVTDKLGLHSALQPLRTLWNDTQGDVAFALGVGYPRQNRSHFRSIEIWETASESEQVLTDGWIGRLFNVADTANTLPADGVVLGGSGMSMNHPSTRRVNLPVTGDLTTQNLVARVDPATQTAAVGHTMRTQATLQDAANAFRGVSATRLGVTFPTSSIGRQLEQAAKVIVSGKQVPVIMVSQGSYDTHAGQLTSHRTLLAELAAALVAFRQALVTANKWNNVLFMSFAEFGRRVAENGSAGTDHGAATAHLLMGGALKGGFYGTQPSLTDLEAGDLKFNIDFRQLYTSIARGFWNMSAATTQSALGTYTPLDMFRSTGA